MQPGQRWRHRSCLDVDMDIVNVLVDGNIAQRIQVLYWNRAGFYHKNMDTVTVRREDMHAWRLLNDDE